MQPRPPVAMTAEATWQPGVLGLKGVDTSDRRFAGGRFSPEGRQPAVHARAAPTFSWPEHGRRVRWRGARGTRGTARWQDPTGWTSGCGHWEGWRHSGWAQALFAEITARDVIAPGNSEQETGNWIGDLARQVFGTAARRAEPVVRSGPHTALPYEQEPPDRAIGEDGVVAADLGPVLTGYATEFARTLAFGSDPHKHCLVENLPKVFAAGRDVFHADSGITGRQVHAEVRAVATPGGWHVGRLAGAPPTANSPNTQAGSFLCPDNDQPLRRTGKEAGRPTGS